MGARGQGAKTNGRDEVTINSLFSAIVISNQNKPELGSFSYPGFMVNTGKS
jgi:hypothetical protein